MNIKLIIALITCSLLLSCDKNSGEEESPWPVWILYVHAKNSETNQPVQNCVRVVWNFQGSNEINTTSCHDTDSDDQSFVKVWRSIREPLTVEYHVECDGYFDSDDMSAYFDPESAYTRPGAPGDEDIVSETVYLSPE
jgi:hypothetical protein